MKKSTKLIILSAIAVLFLFTPAGKSIAQQHHLGKKISITFKEIPLKVALNQIAAEGQFKFSYNSSLIDGNRKVSASAELKSVKDILEHLFADKFQYKSVGNHVVLLEADAGELQPQKVIIHGKIHESHTENPIAGTTVYEVGAREVAISDSSGYYKFSVSGKNNLLNISFTKEGYNDTVINIRASTDKRYNIRLKPAIEAIDRSSVRYQNIKITNIHDYRMVDWFVPRETQITSVNLRLGNTRLFQASFLPYLGTNRGLSGSYENRFSLNILAGYSGGIRMAEFGGIANIVKGRVNGIQIAGMVNFDGSDLKGIQFAGMMNKNTGSISGVQIAGFNNLVLDTLRGVQFSGFQNTLHGTMHGLQLSGFNNYTTQNVDGVQLSGFSNIARKDVKLAQVSGFINISDNVDGLQIAGFTNIAKGDIGKHQVSGFFNYAHSVNGIQLSGFINVSKEKNKGIQASGFLNEADSMQGLQLSGFMNIAKTLNGLQLGVVNISDKVNKGLPVGVFSHVNSGYRSIAFSADEVFYTNLTYKTGLKQIYNIFSVGYDWDENIYGGFGMGTMFDMGKNLQSTLEFESRGIFERNKFDYEGFLNKISYSLETDITEGVALTAGPVLNVYLRQKNIQSNTATLAPYAFYNEVHGSSRLQIWMGGKVGIHL